MTDISDGIQFRRDGVDPNQWPKLSCSEANQLALEISNLRLDAQREILFQGNGQFNASGDMLFLTGGSSPEKLSILANGNVGIGKSEPGAKLEVNGNLKLQQGVAVNEFSSNGTLSNNSDLALPTQKAVKTYVDAQITQVNQTLSTKAALAGASSQDFVTKNLTVSGNLTTTGNVGIGTTSPPTAKLEVNGTVNATSLRAFQSGGSYSSMATFESKNPEPPYVNWLHNRSGGDTVRYGYIQAGDWGDSKQFIFVAENKANFTFVNGNVGIGITNPKAKLDVAGNINTTGIISGASLPPNLIRNSYMNILDGTKPAGYGVLGNVTLEAVHPYTKGFEGPYWQKPANPASSVDTATEANPYYFGQYNKGSRASRGGLADGWHSFSDGRILKITGNNSEVHTSVFFPFERNVLTNKVHFKAWLKIASGSKVGFGADSGYQNVVSGLIITKNQTDAAPDGWYQIDAVIDISEVTSLDDLSFSMGIEASGAFEVYLALPYLANLDNDTWLPSVSDMLSRDGLTVHPSSRNVGIGTINPQYPLHLSGGAYCTGTTWQNASSIEYKEDVVPLALDKALETLAELNPVTFRYKVEEDKKHVGFIAEEVPDLVASKDRKGLSSMDIVGILTKVVQHQQKEIEQLKARLN